MKIILQGGKIKVPTVDCKYDVREAYVLQTLFSKVAEGLKTKLENADQLALQIEEVYIARVEVDYMFKVKGSEDLQQITVQHHDQPEMLTVIVDIDGNGEIKDMANNDKVSLYSDEMVSIMSGNVQKDFEPIVSELPEGVVYQDTVSIADFDIVIHTEEDNSDIVWKQFFQKGKLIQEVKITLEQDQTILDVVNQYKEMVA